MCTTALVHQHGQFVRAFALLKMPLPHKPVVCCQAVKPKGVQGGLSRACIIAVAFLCCLAVTELVAELAACWPWGTSEVVLAGPPAQQGGASQQQTGLHSKALGSSPRGTCCTWPLTPLCA